MNRDDLEKMFRYQVDNNESWRYSKSESTINDVDIEILKQSYEDGYYAERIKKQYKSPEQALKHFDLLYNENYLNKAGELLFSKNRKITLKVVSFATNEEETLTNLQHRKGNIIECYEFARDYITSRLNYQIELTLARRIETPEIPFSAIREILLNSFAHADYRKSVPSHTIRIYSKRIDISNPGSLNIKTKPETFADDRYDSAPRNPLIADVLYQINLIESVGTGFWRTFEICKRKDIKYSYINNEDFFKFIFLRPPMLENDIRNEKNDLSSDEVEVLEKVTMNPKLTREEIADQISKSSRTITRILKKLQEKELLFRVGGNKTGHWLVR